MDRSGLRFVLISQKIPVNLARIQDQLSCLGVGVSSTSINYRVSMITGLVIASWSVGLGVSLVSACLVAVVFATMIVLVIMIMIKIKMTRVVTS